MDVVTGGGVLIYSANLPPVYTSGLEQLTHQLIHQDNSTVVVKVDVQLADNALYGQHQIQFNTMSYVEYIVL